MKWIDLAFAFVFFCNLLFMVGAAYVLKQILDSTEKSQINLQRAASHIVEAGTHVKVIVRKALGEIERSNEINASRESSSGRAVSELTFQIKTLVERLKGVLAKVGGKGGAEPVDAAEGEPLSAEDLRAKLHAELNAALAKNHKLQEEIEQTSYRLKDASTANGELQHELSEVKGVKQSVIDSLMKQAADLEAQLKKAQERAKSAEKMAEANATQLDDIRAQIDEQKFAVDTNDTIDQTELIQAQQDQIDVLADREKNLLATIEQMKNAFQRNQDEKQFIEERFLQEIGGPALPVKGDGGSQPSETSAE